MKTKNEVVSVASVANQELATATKDTAIIASHWSDYAGQGFEKLDQASLKVPFLQIVQALSPCVENGAKPGNILYTLDDTFYDGKEGILFVPAATRHVYVEWRQRSKGGGFIAHHDPVSDVVKAAIAASVKFGKYSHDGNDLVETFYVYGVLVRDDVPCEAAMAFASTKVKPYRMWMTRAKSTTIKVSPRRTIIAPLFSHAYRFTTLKEQNSFGNYYNWRITQESMISQDSDTFIMALGIRDMFGEGAFTESHEPDAVIS